MESDGNNMKPGLVYIVVLFAHLSSIAIAQVPAKDELDRMLLQLEVEDAGTTASIEQDKDFLGRGVRYDVGSATDASCNMQHYSMRLTNNRTGQSNSFSVLLDKQRNAGNIAPQELLALTTVLHVDADGSPRAYHPEDPNGRGVCKIVRTPDGYSATGVCALDQFSSGGIRVFNRGRKITGAELERDWKEFWPLIRDRKLQPTDAQVKGDYYLFHWPNRDLTVFFKKGIIPPTRAGYPCTYNEGAPYAGYFVAATSLTHTKDEDIPDGRQAVDLAPEECRAAKFINAERVPFFVLPGGKIGRVQVGDIVVAQAVVRGQERVAFGVVGDAGPTQSFGEGSIALIQELIGKRGEPVINSKSLNSLDIGRDSKITVAILILGGTKNMLLGNYTRENLEQVGRQEFSRWGLNRFKPADRLRSCIRQGRINPKE